MNRQSINLGSFYKNKLGILLSILYGNLNIKGSSLIIDKDNKLTLLVKTSWLENIVRLFTFKKRKYIYVNIYDLLLNHIPSTLSVLGTGNYGFKLEHQRNIQAISFKYNSNDKENIEHIIDYLFDTLNNMNPRDYFSSLEYITIKETFDSININNIEPLNCNEESMEQEGLTYIVDTFLWGNRKLNLRTKVKTFVLALSLRVVPLYNNLNNTFLDLNKKWYNFYTSKSPPYERLYFYNI